VKLEHQFIEEIIKLYYVDYRNSFLDPINKKRVIVH